MKLRFFVKILPVKKYSNSVENVMINLNSELTYPASKNILIKPFENYAFTCTYLYLHLHNIICPLFLSKSIAI